MQNAAQFPARLLRLPAQGTLLICTDLHGNLADFRRMRRVFAEELARGSEPFLLFTGDLIHGPCCQPAEWPAYLGSHYFDESGELVEQYLQLAAEHPRQVACLLGNHEHSHVGGPHTPKFWPDETLHFEQTVGPLRSQRYQQLFRSLPAVALASCGVAVTHAAPNVLIRGPQDLESLRYEGFDSVDGLSLVEMEILGGLLWSRQCSVEVARRFLQALGGGNPTLQLVIYGHEIAPDGFERVGQEQLMLSTSFGVRQENKYYLRLDLSARYGSVQELRAGRELRRLYL